LYFDEDSSGNVSIRGYTEHGGIYKEVFVPYMRNGKLVDVQTFGKAFAPVVGKIDLANENFGEFTNALTPYSTYNTDWGGASPDDKKKNRSLESWAPQAKKKKEEEKSIALNPDAFKSSQRSAAKSLSLDLEPYGLIVKPTGSKVGGVGYDYIAIYDENGDKLSEDIQVEWSKEIDQKSAEKAFRKQLTNILEKRKAEDKMAAQGQGGGGGELNATKKKQGG